LDEEVNNFQEQEQATLKCATVPVPVQEIFSQDQLKNVTESTAVEEELAPFVLGLNLNLLRNELASLSGCAVNS